MALGSTHPLTEMSTRNLPGGKGRPASKVDNLTVICEPLSRKCASLDGLLQGQFNPFHWYTQLYKDVVYFLRNWIMGVLEICMQVMYCTIYSHIPPLSDECKKISSCLVVRVAGYRYWDPRFDSWRYQIFWEVVGLEWGPLSLVSIIEELLEWKSSGSGLGNRN
jgi:hypothetical protein